MKPRKAIIKPVACSQCGASNGKHIPTTRKPSLRSLIEAMDEGICEATDGCVVEPDGVCEHDHPSWMLELGLI